MRQVLLFSAMALAAASVVAKLPPLDDAAKAKAAEAAAKAAWQAKVDAYQLCKVQDKIAAEYRKTSGRTTAKPDNSAAPPAPAAAATQAAAPAAAAAQSAAPASAASQAATGTPVASTPVTPCADPGPFAYNAPAEKPLETSGAHSPAGNATSPPSVKPNSAEMAPAKK